jgi:hypothetical protein
MFTVKSFKASMVLRIQIVLMKIRTKYIDAVDEWQVSESLQDQNGERGSVPYPLIEGRELFGANEQDDGSVYLGGVNEGRGLGRHRFIRLLFCFSNNSLLDTELEARLDKMEEGDEFEPDELQGLVFSEDEEDLVGHEEKDDW